jgi:hypothetical protein
LSEFAFLNFISNCLLGSEKEHWSYNLTFVKILTRLFVNSVYFRIQKHSSSKLTFPSYNFDYYIHRYNLKWIYLLFDNFVVLLCTYIRTCSTHLWQFLHTNWQFTSSSQPPSIWIRYNKTWRAHFEGNLLQFRSAAVWASGYTCTRRKWRKNLLKVLTAKKAAFVWMVADNSEIKSLLKKSPPPKKKKVM